MNWSSLRIRFGMAYALFTIGCLTLFGAFLTIYLGKALQASRPLSMAHRAAILVKFVENERRENPGQILAQSLDNFLLVSPDTDEILLHSQDGKKLLFAGGEEPGLKDMHVCKAPCYLMYHLHGRNYRTYSIHAVLAGAPVLLTMSGDVDEHYGILRTVRTSYLLFVPFLLVASLGGGYLLSGRALLPVGRMTATASRLSITNLRGRIPVPPTGDELQRLAEAWNDMLGRLQASVERNAQFTSDASHDLRTSIAVIFTSSQLALSRLRSTEEQTRLLRTISSECEHTLTLLEDLLIVARCDSECHELAHEPLELSDLIQKSCSLFILQAEAKEQLFDLELISNSWILGDPTLLRRLLGVLLENAIKYTPHGGSISARVRRAGSNVLLEVCDTGRGIAPSDLPRIFDRHFRSPASQQSERGNGLGLNIARWIAEAHRASLVVESEIDKGSLFRVSFPLFESSTRQAS